MTKTAVKCIVALIVISFVAVSIQAASAATMFAIVLSSDPAEESGWYAGYVAYGSGTYVLCVSASGSQSSFPITDIKVIVCVSDEAAQGGIQSITIQGTPISGYTQGTPSYYGANGGPFSEPDYYGYNDNYVIPSLSYAEGHYPDSSEQLTINVQFSPSATSSSKVMFLCYGTDANGHSLKTAFSNGTLIVPTPEYGLGSLFALGVCFSALAVYKRGSLLAKVNH